MHTRTHTRRVWYPRIESYAFICCCVAAWSYNTTHHTTTPPLIICARTIYFGCWSTEVGNKHRSGEHAVRVVAGDEEGVLLLPLTFTWYYSCNFATTHLSIHHPDVMTLWCLSSTSGGACILIMSWGYIYESCIMHLCILVVCMYVCIIHSIIRV